MSLVISPLFNQVALTVLLKFSLYQGYFSFLSMEFEKDSVLLLQLFLVGLELKLLAFFSISNRGED